MPTTSYAYLTEGSIAGSAWDALARAVQVNLNYLETWLGGLEPTRLRGLEVVHPFPVWSWRTSHGTPLITRIDEVRAAIGLSEFEWTMSAEALENGGRMLSASDLNETARAVGVAAEHVRQPLLHEYYDAPGVPGETGIAIFDGVYSRVSQHSDRGTYDVSRIEPWYSQGDLVSHSASEVEVTIDDGGMFGLRSGMLPDMRLKCFYFASLDRVFLRRYDNGHWLSSADAISPLVWDYSSELEAMEDRGKVDDNVIRNIGNLSNYGVGHGIGEFYYDGSLPFTWKHPGYVIGSTQRYELRDPVMRDQGGSPEVAQLTTLRVDDARRCALMADLIDRSDYRISAIDAEAVEPPSVCAVFCEDPNTGPFRIIYPIERERTEPRSPEGPTAFVASLGTYTRNAVVCGIIPDKEWSARPNPETRMELLDSYREDNRTTHSEYNNGTALVRNACYAAISTPLPVVWYASSC